MERKKTIFWVVAVSAIIVIIAAIAAALYLPTDPVSADEPETAAYTGVISSGESGTDIDERTDTDIPEGPSIPENETLRVVSPDGKYRAEAYGTNKSITAAGLYPYEGLRVIRSSDEVVIWSGEGYYIVEFIWSSNSKYVAVYGEARIYGECFVVDAEAGEAIGLPSLNDISGQLDAASQPAANRPDPYFKAVGWVNDTTLRVNFRWMAQEDERIVSGTYEYDITSGNIVSISSDIGDTPG
jgi:hypothetical protein